MATLKVSSPTVQKDCTCSTADAIYLTGKSTCENLYNLSQTQATSKEDLLRAVLLFSCSTIDSVGKQLAKDCLKEVIDVDEGAQKIFEEHISRKIKQQPEKLLARALSNPDYRGELIKFVIESIDGTSLQSYQQISELTAKFGIVTDEIISQDKAKAVFDARQKIIHEMDIEVLAESGSRAQRRTRAENELKQLSEGILEAACKLIDNVHKKIHEPRAKDT